MPKAKDWIFRGGMLLPMGQRPMGTTLARLLRFLLIGLVVIFVLEALTLLVAERLVGIQLVG